MNHVGPDLIHDPHERRQLLGRGGARGVDIANALVFARYFGSAGVKRSSPGGSRSSDFTASVGMSLRQAEASASSKNFRIARFTIPSSESPDLFVAVKIALNAVQSRRNCFHEGSGGRRPDITMEMVDKFLTKMYRTNPDFVFTVTREFVRSCRTPLLILPDDIPAHPYAVAMEAAMLAPKAEVSMFPWKEPKERIPLAVRQIRSFLRAHRPASA